MQITVEQVNQIILEHYGITSHAYPLYAHDDINFKVVDANGDKYVLKISATNSQSIHLQCQNEVLKHLGQSGLAMDTPQVIPTLNGNDIFDIYLKDKLHLGRLLTWVEGRLWHEVNPRTNALIHQAGLYSGEMNVALSNFDHAGAHRKFEWDLVNLLWIEDHIGLFKNESQRRLIQLTIDDFKSHIRPAIKNLRKSVIHNDINDHNVLVQSIGLDAAISGLIDFGDVIYTSTVCELGIAVAYLALRSENPLEVAYQFIKGFHQAYPIEEAELAVLYYLVKARLAISLTSSEMNRIAAPDNPYLFVTTEPAWRLLSTWTEIDPDFAHYTFRAAIGLPACPHEKRTYIYLQSKACTFKPLLGESIDLFRAPVLDLSVRHSNLISEPPLVAVGRYGEPRMIYTSDNFSVKTNDGSEKRTYHMGVDLLALAGTEVFAPIDGVVFSAEDNAIDKDYGPTIVLHHETTSGTSFYTLYGHLSRIDLEQLEVGQAISAGDVFAHLGDSDENGGWPSHLHFQLILNMVGHTGSFPGVALPSQLAIWKSICPNPTMFVGNIPIDYQHPATKSELVQKRKTLLGSSLSLAYNDPLYIVRGSGQFLYNEHGQCFLDTVNNIAHVGHEHPRLTAVAHRQMTQLNTNTRYLHENILGYAEALLSKFPKPLDVCYFVNSGSEANELALRIAKTVTRRRRVLSLQGAYHGNTNQLIDVSSYKHDGPGGSGKPLSTTVIPLVDMLNANTGEDVAVLIKQLSTYLENNNLQLDDTAAFIFETVLSCAGQIEFPKDVLSTLVSVVKKHGILTIADEIQVGFGRLGRHFWGFETHDVIPDIVVLGKPIGNGHPLGAVVTTREIATQFDNGMEFFSSFGGNPVSMAIGHEVLKIIDEENLQENALEVGQYFKQELMNTKKAYSVISNVRGSGLFLGVELRDDSGVPLPKVARYISERACQNGVLMSVDGLENNVIKIKPPMVFNKDNVDYFSGVLHEILKEDLVAHYYSAVRG